MDAVAPKQVAPRSRSNCRCMSRLPGPTGMVSMPSFSLPSWKPAPAVQRPYPTATCMRSAGVSPASS